MEAYCWEVKPSVEIQKNFSVKATYKWRLEECVGDTKLKPEGMVFCAKGTGL